MTTPVQTSSQSRIFAVRYGAGPGRPLEYDGRARATAVADPAGDLTPIREPDPYEFGKFRVVGKIRGAPGLVTTSLERRRRYGVSSWKKWKDASCPIDVHVNFGLCSSPDAHNDAELIDVFERADISAYNATDLGAIDEGQNIPINETLPLSAEAYYQIDPQLRLTELNPSGVTREILDIDICDRVNCGNFCGAPSDGCGKIFALSVAAGGSPGLPADVIVSSDGGATWGKTNIDTLAVASSPNHMACVGQWLVVTSTASPYIHYALQSEIIANPGSETWYSNTSGINVAGTPNAIFAYASSQVWVVGTGGYVYFYSDITGTPTIQTAGSVTSENLSAVHGCDEDNIVAVGANNAVIVTTDGGDTWQSVTGPAAGVALNTVWVKDPDTWFIGTAGGALWYTNDSGANWTQIRFPGDNAGQVRAIKFNDTPSQTVGWMVHDTAAPAGRVLRSLDGGNNWDVLPKVGTGVANDRFNDVALCNDVNLAYVGGLADNGTDGVIARVA